MENTIVINGVVYEKKEFKLDSDNPEGWIIKYNDIYFLVVQCGSGVFCFFSITNNIMNNNRYFDSMTKRELFENITSGLYTVISKKSNIIVTW